MATTDYLRVTEAANQIGISRQQLWLYINDERVKAVNKFGIWLISQTEIDRFKKTRITKQAKSNNRKNGKGR